MSAELFGLIGVVVGALLGGVANLLFAWRRETVEARAGAQVVVEVLARAGAALSSVLALPHGADVDPMKQPSWWRPGAVPTSAPWQGYRGAMSSRLSPQALGAVEHAMAGLDSLDERASEATRRSDELTARMLDVLVQSGTAPDDTAREHSKQLEQRLAKEAQQRDYLGITNDDRALLRDVRDRCVQALVDVRRTSPARIAKANTNAKAPVDNAEDGGWGRMVVARARWHRRPLTAAVVLVVGAAIALGAALPLPEQPAERVERQLSQYVQGEALTACEPVKDRPSRVTCVLFGQANEAACQMAARRNAARIAGTGVAFAADGGCGKGDTRPIGVLETIGVTRGRQDCTMNAITGVSVPRNDAEAPATPDNPRRFAKLLERAKKVFGKGSSSTETGELPRTLTSSGTFSTC